MKKSNQLKSKAIKDVYFGTSVTIISRLGGLIFSVIVARFLMPESFGLYTLALSLILIVTVFADSGVNNAIVRYLSESLRFQDTKSKTRAANQLNYLFKLKISISTTLAIILFFYQT